MSENPPNPVTPPPSGGFVQPTPGAPPVPVGYGGHPTSAPEPPPRPPAPPYTPAPTVSAPGGTPLGAPGAQVAPGATVATVATVTAPDTRSGPSGMGALALVLALVALVGATLVSAVAGFAAADGAARGAMGMSASALESLSGSELLSLLTPVRGLVLWTEIGFWAGTLLGIAAIALGIVAIARRRGRALGVAAVVIAALAPFVYAGVVMLAVIGGIGVSAV